MKPTRYFFISIFISILICSSAYPFTSDIMPLNDSNYFKTVHSLFTKAKSSIYIIMYQMKWYDEYPDSLSNKLINSLILAKKRGVDVRVILDASEFQGIKSVKSNCEKMGRKTGTHKVGGNYLDKQEEKEKIDSRLSAKDTDNEKVAKILSKGGIKVYFDSESITTHSKLIVVDAQFVILGSTNWSYYSLSKNNETNVLIDSKEIAKEYIKYFEELANLCK